jgi:hypothetical protein
MSDITVPTETASATNHRQARIREGLTMALYIGLSLLAVMLTLPSDLTATTDPHPAVTLFLTSMGLLVAHQFAFRLSARLAHQGEIASEHLDLLAAQLVGGLAITAVTIIPVIFIEGQRGILFAELELLAFIAIVGYVASRTGGASRARAFAYVLGVIVVTLVVLWIKGLVHH